MKGGFIIIFFLMSHILFSQTVEDKVYFETEVDSVAQFPGGKDAFKKLAQREVIYPSVAKRKETMGTITLEIIIDEKGIPIVKLLKDIGDDCGEAALKGFRKITLTWKPAQKNGIPVKMKFIQKVEFKLDRKKFRKERLPTIQIP